MRIDGTVYYVLKDRLGSAYATTDATGNVVGEMRYYAFGETRLSTGTMFTDRLYTGQRQIAELGIYHFNARFYSPKLGRFLSADTLMSGFANPQSLNRFAYVANNPVRYTDPTGRCFIELSSHMVWFSDSDPKCGGSYTPTNDGGGGSGSDDGSSDPQDMETSEQGENFIIYWENAGGYPDQYPYEDAGGTCTIGYGHVLYNPGEGCSGWPNKTWNAENPLSLEEAENFLVLDLDNAENIIKDTITVDITQAQFDALVSYTFNSSDQSNSPYFEKGIPDLINSGSFEAAAAAIASGPNTSGGTESDTLIERRQAEADLFLTGNYGNYVPWSPP
jgi:RHS repeat-associated protein